MPPFDTMTAVGANNMLLRVLAYGQAKTRKTWWAYNAVRANFNVIALDGDIGYHIGMQIPEEYRHRLQILNVNDTADIPIFARFMAQAFSTSANKRAFIWDEQSSTNVTTSKMQDAHSHYQINFSKLGSGDILVVDSWTKLCISLMWQYSNEQNISFEDAKKVEWDGYGWAGRAATFFLQQLVALPCHLIVIAHEDVYEKRKTTIGVNGKAVQTVEWSRIQPKSVSGPHAMSMGRAFSDIYHFQRAGSMNRIDTSGSRDRDGGSRIIQPKVFNWDELQFDAVCKVANITLPLANNPPPVGCIWFAPSEKPIDDTPPVVKQVLNSSTQITAIVPTGSAPVKASSLFAMKKG